MNTNSENIVASAPVRFFYWLGLRVMMDFGFGTFLDKFERRFGNRATTAMLVLIGLSLTSFCLNLIATYTIIPAISLIYSIMETDRFGSYQTIKTVQVLLNIFLFMMIYLGFRAALETHRERKAAQRIYDEYMVFRDFVVDFWDHTGDFYVNLQQAVAQLEGAKNKAQREKAIAQLQAAIDSSRQDYATRVTGFNESVEKSDYFRRAKLLVRSETTEDQGSSGQLPPDTATDTRQ